MPLSETAKYENEAEKLRVSIKSRTDGFYNWFKNNDGKLNIPIWIQKRNGYIARTLPLYKKNPTYRRWLSLVFWNYYTKPIHIEPYLNSSFK